MYPTQRILTPARSPFQRTGTHQVIDSFAHSKVDKLLARYKLRRVGVPGDGNCQFWSMSLFFTDVDHLRIRRMICDYIRDNAPIFSQDILNSDYHTVDQYLQYMRRPGTWGDAITLQAFGLLFDIDVILFMPDGMTQFHPDRSRHVGMIREGCHYEAALPIKSIPQSSNNA